MPQIICHECGRKRLVVAGKRKVCRGCGTKLTDQQQPLTKLLKAEGEKKKAKKMTVEDLANDFPKQVAEIVQAARADICAEEFGDLKPQDIEGAFPDEVAAIVLKATNEMTTAAEIAKTEHADAIKKLKAEHADAIKANTADLTKKIAAAEEATSKAISDGKKAMRDAVKAAKVTGRNEVLAWSVGKFQKRKQAQK